MTELASPEFAFRSRLSVLRLAGIYGASRTLGFLREVGIAYLFGTSAAADRLNVAFVAASLATIVGGEAVYAGTIRSLSNQPGEGDFAALMRASFRLATIGTLLFAVAAPPVALLMVGGSANGPTQVTLLVLCLAPSVGAGIAAGCMNGKLTLDGRIARMNSAQLCYSAGAIAGLAVVELSDAGPAAVAAGWSAGNLAGLLVLFLAVRPARDRHIAGQSPGALAVLIAGLPVAVAFTLIALQSVTDRVIAGRLEVGDIAALGYADRLFLMPTGFVLAFFAPAVLGALSARLPSGPAAVGEDAIRQLRQLVIWTLPATLIAVAASPVIVEVVFEYGAFDARSSDATTAAFDGLAAGIAATSLSLVLLRVMQAALPLRTLAVVALSALVLNAAVSLLLSWPLDLLGVALGTSLTACSTAAIQVALLTRRLGSEWGRKVALECVAPVVAAFAVAAAVGTAAHTGAMTTVSRVGLALVATPLLLPLLRRVRA